MPGRGSFRTPYRRQWLQAYTWDMRVYWWQAGLHIEPESAAELEMLHYLETHVHLGRGLREESFSFIPREEIPKGDVSSEPGNEQPV